MEDPDNVYKRENSLPKLKTSFRETEVRHGNTNGRDILQTEYHTYCMNQVVFCLDLCAIVTKMFTFRLLFQNTLVFSEQCRMEM